MRIAGTSKGLRQTANCWSVKACFDSFRGWSVKACFDRLSQTGRGFVWSIKAKYLSRLRLDVKASFDAPGFSRCA